MSGGHHLVDYLRLSVTDRCNLRCVYCMPAEGVVFKPHEEILSYEDMVFFVECAVDVGISKVRVTGGEPLVRKGLVELIRMLRAIPGVNDISLTTNGILLPVHAATLKEAGLARVNISLDSLDPERYRCLTRGGSLREVLAGVEAAFIHDLQPVKTNAVMMPELLGELDKFVAITRDRPLHVRFIEWMRAGGCGPPPPTDSPTKADLIAALETIGELQPVDSPGGWGPARYFRMAGHLGTIGFIGSMSDHFCEDCNRLRLTADGRLKNCLFSNDEVDVKAAVRARNRERTLACIRKSLARKTFDKNLIAGRSELSMSQVGG